MLDMGLMILFTEKHQALETSLAFCLLSFFGVNFGAFFEVNFEALVGVVGAFPEKEWVENLFKLKYGILITDEEKARL
jgi:hypothetical protein